METGIRRRKFLGVMGGAAGWTFAAHAQQPAKLPIIGMLDPASQPRRIAATRQRLQELGWIDGRTVTIEYRQTPEQRFDEILAEFVRRKVDVIFTSGTPPVIAAKKATSSIPIVFVSVGDPIGSGLVMSLARPGANITGVANQTADLAGKRVGLLREMLPNLRKLAVMTRMDNPSSEAELREVQSAAGTLGIQAFPLEIRRAEDIGSAFETLRERPDALYVVIDALLSFHASRINTLALGSRLPTMHGSREHVETGGLMSYGADFQDIWRRGADYIDKILRGTKPADIPVEQPTMFDFVINQTTAKVLAIDIPLSLLGRANAVIE
jgi:putative tryptophan/tyrosine transport system substrate-binding protein